MNHYPEINTIPQFERLIQPLNETQVEELKNELLTNPASRIIRTWNGSHLNDSMKYELCKDLDLPVTTDRLIFDSLPMAGAHVCLCELKKDDLTDEYRKYITGRYFDYKLMLTEKSSNRGNKYIVAGQIAHEMFVSAGTVMKYSLYSDAMDYIFDQSTDLAQRILLNRIRVSHENVIELSRLRPEEVRSIALAAERDGADHLSLSYIRNEVKWSHIIPRAPISRREKAEKKMQQAPAIRQMPVYDPDSEVNSLCMTIDSWVSSIQRVSSSSNFDKISLKATLHLMKKLSFLEHTVKSVQESLVERTNYDG